ncbi:lipocalin-like domain-containing protein [Burkholderia sp. PAMC 26561]|uniref:lipocalin-like domain-containing protein n=1 Tax=Burkholderia sp. PAMC 26561 TaxID=1795043 RepID=UPI003FA41B6E
MSGPPDLSLDAIGTWDLESYTSYAKDGTSRQDFGESPIGRAIFDRAGNFSMLSSDRTCLTSHPAIAVWGPPNNTKRWSRAVLLTSVHSPSTRKSKA